MGPEGWWDRSDFLALVIIHVLAYADEPLGADNVGPHCIGTGGVAIAIVDSTALTPRRVDLQSLTRCRGGWGCCGGCCLWGIWGRGRLALVVPWILTNA